MIKIRDAHEAYFPPTPSDVDLPAPLRTSQLDPLAEQAANALRQEGESRNTVASYRSALRYWSAWHALRYRQPVRLPLAPAVVIQFIVDHATRQTPQGPVCEMPPAVDQALVADGCKARPGPPALSTLSHRLAVIAKAHQLQGLPNPCADAAVRELMASTRRAYARRGHRQARKAALTRAPLLRLLDTCDGSLAGLRDRALLLFAWASGGRRRSEVARATMDNLTRVGPGDFVYVLGWSKTNQSGSEHADTPNPSPAPPGRRSRRGWPPRESNTVRCFAASGAVGMWEKACRMRRSAASSRRVARWRGWTATIPRIRCARALSRKRRHGKCRWLKPWP